MFYMKSLTINNDELTIMKDICLNFSNMTDSKLSRRATGVFGLQNNE